MVHAGGWMVSCSLSTRLRKELVYPTGDSHRARRAVKEVKINDHVDPVAIGDVVRFLEAQSGTGQIIAVLPRRNRLARRTAAPMPGAHTFRLDAQTISRLENSGGVVLQDVYPSPDFRFAN